MRNLRSSTPPVRATIRFTFVVVIAAFFLPVDFSSNLTKSSSPIDSFLSISTITQAHAKNWSTPRGSGVNAECDRTVRKFSKWAKKAQIKATKRGKRLHFAINYTPHTSGKYKGRVYGCGYTATWEAQATPKAAVDFAKFHCKKIHRTLREKPPRFVGRPFCSKTLVTKELPSSFFKKGKK